MPLNPDIVRASHRNKQRGGETEQERERIAERSITTVHTQSLNFYCLCSKPFDFRPLRGEGKSIPLVLACASISPPHIKAVISRGL